jgi:hypothetical protein
VVADAVECLRAQVEIGQHDIGPPDRMVITAGHIRGQRILAGVAAWSMPAVVPERHGFDERDVEPAGAADAAGHLRDLERVRQPGALMVCREDEHLRLTRKTAKRARAVQDAVTVAFETGAVGIGHFGDQTLAGARRPCGTGGKVLVLRCFARFAFDGAVERDSGMAVGMRAAHRAGGMTGHGRDPLLRARSGRRSDRSGGPIIGSGHAVNTTGGV